VVPNWNNAGNSPLQIAFGALVAKAEFLNGISQIAVDL
jgi:hypothetical protein